MYRGEKNCVSEVIETVAVKYLGHSAFLLTYDKAAILIDPFLSGNPCAAASPSQVHADLILVTHAHSDHLGDAIDISKRTGAPILSTFELAGYCMARKAKTIDGHIGGVIETPYCTVKIFPALHGSSDEDCATIGVACSFVISVDNKTIYHAGDTALFGDMKLIAEEFDLDVALLPIGGHYDGHRRCGEGCGLP